MAKERNRTLREKVARKDGYDLGWEDGYAQGATEIAEELRAHLDAIARSPEYSRSSLPVVSVDFDCDCDNHPEPTSSFQDDDDYYA